MNILILNHYAGAPRLGRELRPYFLAKYWQAAGHTVTIAAADHTHLRRNDPVEGPRPESRSLGGVDYLFFPTPRYNDSVTGRGRNIAAFVRGVWQEAPSLAQQLRPHVVIAQSGYPYDLFAARRIAAAAHAKTVLEVRDLWPLQLQEHYRYPSGHSAVRFASCALRRAVGEADRVVTVLPGGAQYLASFGLQPEKHAHILSGVSAALKNAPPPAGLAQRVERFRGEKGLLVMYCGNVGINHDLRPFAESAALLDSSIRLVVVGNGGNKITLKRLSRERNLQNLLFLDGVSPRQVPSVLQLADLLFFPVRPSRQLEYGFASAKLLEYMLSARPVLCDADPMGNPVSLAGCGMTLRGRTAEEIAGGIRAMAAMGEQQRQEMGRRGREYVLAHREYRLLAGQYLSLLEELTERGGT